MAQQADRQGVVAARAAPRAPDVALPDADVLQPHVLPDESACAQLPQLTAAARFAAAHISEHVLVL